MFASTYFLVLQDHQLLTHSVLQESTVVAWDIGNQYVNAIFLNATQSMSVRTWKTGLCCRRRAASACSTVVVRHSNDTSKIPVGKSLSNKCVLSVVTQFPIAPITMRYRTFVSVAGHDGAAAAASW